MAKKLRTANGSEVAAAIRTVFVDTSLDTHLAMVLSDLDTVSDLKRKIAKEHALCFTNVGSIVVHALKVKRKGHLYHLSDSMFVKDAFDGANKNWFLSVDVSIVQNKHNEERLVHIPDSQNLLTCRDVLCNTAVNAVDLPLSVSPEQGTGDPNKGREVPQKHVEHKSDASKQAILEQRDKSVKEASQSDCTAKRKRTFEDKVGNERLQDESIDTCRDISKREIVSQRALGDEEKIEKADLGGLASKPVDDNHPVMNNSSIEKRKRRKKSNSEFDQAGAADQSAARDVLEESYMTTTAVGQRASGGEPDTSSVPGQGENGIKHSNVIRDAGEYVFSSEDEHESDTPEEEATSLAAKMGNSKDHYPVEVESNHPLVVEKHDNLPVGMRNSGQDDIGTDQAERSEEQGALSKKKGSLKTQLKKHDNLPLDIGISRQENVGSGQAGRAEEQGDLTKKKGSAKMLPEKHDDLPLDTGISGHENIESVQAGRVEEQGSLSKKKDSLTKDTGISGHENIASVQAGRVEEQGSLSKKKDSLTTRSRKNDNLSTEVSGQENVGSEQAERAEEQGPFSKTRDSFKMQPKKLDDLPADVGVSGQENIESGQAEIAEDQRALSQRKDSLKTQSKKLNSRRLDDAEDANATADLLGENGTVEPTESSKKRRRNKKTKDLVQKIVTTSVMEAVEGSEINVSVKSRGAKGGEPPIDGARNEESILSQTNGKEELRSNAESTFLAKENGEFTGNEVKSMRQTSKYEENAENVKEKVGQRSKKKQKSAKKLSDVQLEDRRVIHQNSAAQADNKSQVVASSDTKDKGNLKKTAVKGNLNEEKRETESLEVQKELVPAQPAQSNSVLAKSTKVQSKSLDHKYKGNAGEADLLDNPLNSADKASKEIEISVEGNKGDFEKPLPENVTSSGVLIDKKIGANKVANKVAKTPKAKKNIEKPDTQSDQTSADFQSSMKSNKKQGIEGKPPAGKSSTNPLQGSSLSKDNVDESAVQPKKKLQKASRNKAKAPSSDVSGKVKSTPKETKAQNVVSVSNIKSQKNTGLASVSNSHVESSRKLISKDAATNKGQPGLANAKAANKENGKTVNSLKPSKKLRATAGAIFRDDNSGESSEDEGVDGSDASTKTPSDYSESSDYSDGESNANFNSPRKGSYTSDRSKSVGRRTIKSCSSSAKNLNFRSLLTSSSRFKKAKLTASQLQLEDPDESQPVEFVPDSLPIE